MLTVLQPQKVTFMEGLDHLFLVPERALTMGSARLQMDLAGHDFNGRILHEAPMGNVWISGSRPLSAAKEEKENRIRNLKERQNEERQRKLEEIKAQALSAQRFKEQMENERRKRLEEWKLKEDTRRQQAEHRRKAIIDAERDRLECILRRNQEKEARIELKRRNESSAIPFAFGSSTPRMLDTKDSSSSFWGHRRATSTQNIPSVNTQLTCKPENLNVESKKRATSVNGLERTTEGTTQNPAGCASGYVGRRRTDLMPTVISRESASQRKHFTRSPGRAYSMSRLDQLAKPRKRTPELPAVAESTVPSPSRPLSHVQQSSVSRSMSHLAFSKLGPVQPPRPLRKLDSRSMHQLSVAPLPPPRTTRASQLRQQKLANSTSSEASSRPSSSLSQQSTSSVTSSVVMRHRPLSAPRHARPASIAVTGITHDFKKDSRKVDNKPPIPKTAKPNIAYKEKLKKKPIVSPTEPGPKPIVSPVETGPKPVVSPAEDELKLVVSPTESGPKPVVSPAETGSKPVVSPTETELKPVVSPTESGPQPVVSPTEAELKPIIVFDAVEIDVSQKEGIVDHRTDKVSENVVAEVTEKVDASDKPVDSVEKLEELKQEPEESTAADLITDNPADMTASLSAKVRLNTEEEAKAALAERRRIAREEAEKQAELERLRIEEEARLELERQQREEEQQRLLIEQQRAAEQERLEEAIREAKKREEEERIKREEEQRLKVLKEEADKKAREEAERQKAELQERLKNEEKEREARRKRVEAIMLRTRAKTNSNNTQSQNEEKKAPENGHRNGKGGEIVDNIIPVDSIKNANTVNVETLGTEDTLNSNNAWQHNTQPDLLM